VGMSALGENRTSKIGAPCPLVTDTVDKVGGERREGVALSESAHAKTVIQDRLGISPEYIADLGSVSPPLMAALGLRARRVCPCRRPEARLVEAILVARIVQLLSRGLRRQAAREGLTGLLIRPSATSRGALKPRSANPDGARDHFPDRRHCNC
jgi:hypothetical protein